MTDSGFVRARRLAERIRADLAELLIRGAVRDPDAQGAIVTGVEMSRDLSAARIYLRLLDTEADEDRKKRLLEAMRRASRLLRRSIGRTLALRRVPELRFAWDDIEDRAARVERVLREIRAERRGGEREER
jgi:ribosome-binding factor A